MNVALGKWGEILRNFYTRQRGGFFSPFGTTSFVLSPIALPSYSYKTRSTWILSRAFHTSRKYKSTLAIPGPVNAHYVYLQPRGVPAIWITDVIMTSHAVYIKTWQSAGGIDRWFAATFRGCIISPQKRGMRHLTPHRVNDEPLLQGNHGVMGAMEKWLR